MRIDELERLDKLPESTPTDETIERIMSKVKEEKGLESPRCVYCDMVVHPPFEMAVCDSCLRARRWW